MTSIEQAKAHLKEHKLSEALECCEQCEESEEKSELRQKILKYKDTYERFGKAIMSGMYAYSYIKPKPDVAIEMLTKAIEVTFDPGVNEYLDEYRPAGSMERICLDLDRTELYTWRAEAYLEKNNYDAAIADFTKVIEHFDPPMLHFHAGACFWQRAEAYLEKAKRSFESGDCDIAYECCEKALEMLQNDWSGLWEHVKGKYFPEDSWEHRRYKRLEDLKKEIVKLKGSFFAIFR